MLRIINTSQRGDNEVRANTVTVLLKPHEHLKCYSPKVLHIEISTLYISNLHRTTVHQIINTYLTLEIPFIFFTLSV